MAKGAGLRPFPVDAAVANNLDVALIMMCDAYHETNPDKAVVDSSSDSICPVQLD